jgi:hypothetical protein
MSEPHGGPVAAPFTDAEIHEFQKSDRGAGAIVILLMTGIFLSGVLIYGVIAFVTS